MVLGTFTMNGVPSVLSNQLASGGRPNHLGSPVGGKRPNQGQEPSPNPPGRSIMNPNQPAAWKITDTQEYGFFLCHLRDAPLCWGDGVQACANYWIRGVCSIDCNRSSGHAKMEDCAKAKFGRFVAATRAAYCDNPAGP
jgi:hypothetical protein